MKTFFKRQIWDACALSLILAAIIPNLAIAKNWYVKDWYGAQYKDSCLITTVDERTNRGLSFGFSDGRHRFNDFTFNPISTVSISNILPPVAENTYFELEVLFNDTISFDTVVRSNIVDGEAQISSTQIYNNKVVDYFQGEELDHELLVTLMKKSHSMKLSNNKGQELARFSLMGFTQIFAKYSDCIKSLEP